MNLVFPKLSKAGLLYKAVQTLQSALFCRFRVVLRNTAACSVFPDLLLIWPFWFLCPSYFGPAQLCFHSLELPLGVGLSQKGVLSGWLREYWGLDFSAPADLCCLRPCSRPLLGKAEPLLFPLWSPNGLLCSGLWGPRCCRRGFSHRGRQHTGRVAVGDFPPPTCIWWSPRFL